MKKSILKNRQGVSLTELLVVIGIVMVLYAIGIISIGSLEDKNKLDQLSSQVKSALYKAQTKTINEDYYGIYFNQDRFVLFRGMAYIEGNPDNIVEVLPDGYRFISINFTQQKINFQKISGYVDNYISPANVTLQDIQTGQSRIISVNKLGTVEIE